jgi:hypothetical protein
MKKNNPEADALPDESALQVASYASKKRSILLPVLKAVVLLTLWSLALAAVVAFLQLVIAGSLPWWLPLSKWIG